MKIGSVKLRNNLFLAPLAGFTCNAFRLLCKEFGAGLVFAPIMNEKALINNPREVIDVIDEERPVAGQIIGKDSLKISKAASIVEPFVDIIDFNLGCPRRKEVRCGIGAVLLRKPEKVKKLVSFIIKSVSKPVTVKVRLGFKEVNVLKITRIVEECGVSAITVHARTVTEDYGVPADWSWIKKVKEHVSIPVIGNGDIFSPVDVKKMIDETGCDAVMIARGANGNPFIFRNSLKYLSSGVMPTMPSRQERVNAFLKFVKYYHKYALKQSFHELKLHAFLFLKGLPNVKALRNKVLKARDEGALISLLKE
jgi:nifR3 family TIM-barrel protein